jgi:membrane protease subunit HflK
VFKLLAAVIVFLILAISSYYQVEPDELGVVTRFGAYKTSSEPGPHFKIPFVDTVQTIPAKRQLKQEFGFRTVRAGINSEYASSPETKGESLMLTGDLNVVDAEWIVQYKIRDPFLFLFKMREAEATFRDMTEAVVRRVVGDSSVDEVITVGRTRIADESKSLLQQLCDSYEIGIEVNQLIFQDVNPPESVKPSFNDVNEALQEKEKKINESWAEYNQVIPRAAGEAEQVLRGAEGYATERVNNAAGDANRFSAVYREYAKAPAVTRKRLYLEALNDILPKINRKIVVDQNQRNVLPLLNLGEEVKK